MAVMSYSCLVVLVAFLRLQLCTEIIHSTIKFSSHLSIFQVVLDRSVRLFLLWISEQFGFYGVRLLASRPTPNLEDQDIPLRLTLPLDLSGLGDPTSSYATAGIALRVSGALKHYHHHKETTPCGRQNRHFAFRPQVFLSLSSY
jgi:hypothetical protein